MCLQRTNISRNIAYKGVARLGIPAKITMMMFIHQGYGIEVRDGKCSWKTGNTGSVSVTGKI